VGEGRPAGDGAAPRDGAALPPAGYSALSLRTTGGSMVELADRTNSPDSASLVIKTLLSTPSSFASS
jgi:hypothetical protein